MDIIKISIAFPTAHFPQLCQQGKIIVPAPPHHLEVVAGTPMPHILRRCNTAWTTAPTSRGQTRGNRIGLEVNSFTVINGRSCIFCERTSDRPIRPGIVRGAGDRCEKKFVTGLLLWVTTCCCLVTSRSWGLHPRWLMLPHVTTTNVSCVSVAGASFRAWVTLILMNICKIILISFEFPCMLVLSRTTSSPYSVTCSTDCARWLVTARYNCRVKKSFIPSLLNFFLRF